MKKRKNYNKWVHYSRRRISGDDPLITICGKTSESTRVERTRDEQKVTCPRCLDMLDGKINEKN